MNVTILDFKGNRYDTDVSMDDVDTIAVTVISGDESLLIYLKNGEFQNLDANDFSGYERSMSFFNGSYLVPSEYLEKWNDRKDSYDWATNGECVIGTF